MGPSSTACTLRRGREHHAGGLQAPRCRELLSSERAGHPLRCELHPRRARCTTKTGRPRARRYDASRLPVVVLLWHDRGLLSLTDLAAATRSFSPDNIIGDGSFGFVYRAMLPDGAAVAVKRLSGDGDAGAGNREFHAELEVLGSLSHPNLMRLPGYCTADRDRILVYELLECGSLDAWLHGGDAEDGGGTETLPWPARLADPKQHGERSHSHAQGRNR
ncbi:phytosulfokine receptor 1-like [Miscanthus floridulus]|uniref:phytosulfokine receptor 1-like n=1 Tax=Miscanthus floridulus TaxID=154761 RepID=UPI003459103D